MWPFGHVALAYVVYVTASRLYSGRRPGPEETLVLVFGSLFPDLIDKPLAWYLGVIPTGSSLAHSLVVVVPVSVLAVLIARRDGRTSDGLAFATGTVSHVVADAVPAFWDPETCVSELVWPLVSRGDCPTELSGELLGPFAGSLWAAYLLVEFGLIALAVILWRADGYPGYERVRSRLERGH